MHKLTLLLIGLSCQVLNAQKFDVQYFSDVSTVEGLVLYQNNLWVVTDGGLLQMDMNGSIVKKYEPLRDSMPHSLLYIHQDQQGVPWLNDTQNDRLMRLNGSRWEVVAQTGYLNKGKKQYAKITAGQIWLHAEDSLLKYEKGKWRAFRNPFPEGEYPNQIYQTTKGEIWAADYRKIMFMNGLAVKNIPLPSAAFDHLDFYEDKIYYIREDGESGVDANGESIPRYVIYYWAGEKWEVAEGAFEKKFYKYCDDIQAYKDKKWLLSRNKDSLHCFQNNQWTSIAIPFLKKGIYADREFFCTPKCDATGRVWLGSTHGRLLIWDGKTWTTKTIPNKSPCNNYHINLWNAYFVDSKGTVWVGGADGIFYYDKTGWNRLPNHLFKTEDFVVQQFIESTNGTIYVALRDVIYKKTEKGWELVLDGLSFPFIYTKTGGDIGVIGGLEETLTIKANGEIQRKSMEALRRYDTYLKHSLATTDGSVWIPALGSILQYKNDSLIQHPISMETTLDKMRTFCLEDKKGNVYTFSKNQAAQFIDLKGDSLTNPLLGEGKIKHAIVDKSGTIWASTSYSFWRYEQGKWISNLQLMNVLNFSQDDFFVDNSGCLWFKNKDNHLCVFDTQKRQMSVVFTMPFRSWQIVRIMEDKTGGIWLFCDIGNFCVRRKN